MSQLGRYAEAQPLLIGSYRVIAQVRGPDHWMTHKTLRGLIAHFEAVGDAGRAAEY